MEKTKTDKYKSVGTISIYIKGRFKTNICITMKLIQIKEHKLNTSIFYVK